ncbi:MAG: ABC transporter permease [Lachnospiraceae bacterium]|nr:ABC transporter permease [Lachnospiraceae bacterium]
MAGRSFGTFRIAGKNIKAGNFKNVSIIILIAFTAFFLFGGNLIVYGMSEGLNQVRQRLGADLIIVPAGKGREISGILLEGEAGFFYLDNDLVSKVSETEGVKNVTGQYYFASAAATCCDSAKPIEIIGYDPDTDFVIRPWIEKKINRKLDDNAIVIGSDIDLKENNTIKLYDEYYPVIAQLDKTGTSMDQSVYTTKDTIIKIRRSALKKGFDFFSGEEDEIINQISSILVQVDEGSDLRAISRAIESNAGEVEVVEVNSTLNAISSTLNSIKEFFFVFAILFLAMASTTLFIVYYMCAGERKKEFSLMRMIGMTRAKVLSVVLTENILQGLAGSIAGLTAAGLFMYPFSALFNVRIRQPFAFPGVPGIVLLGLLSIFVTTFLGTAAGLLATYYVCTKDTYDIMREGE